MDYHFTYDLARRPQIPTWKTHDAERKARELCYARLNDIMNAFPTCNAALQGISIESCMEDIKVKCFYKISTNIQYIEVTGCPIFTTSANDTAQHF